MIVLGRAPAAPGPEAREGPAPAAHWRRWRHVGTALSALLHVLIVGAFMIGLPRAKVAEREAERPVPVEIVKPDEVKKKEPEKAKETEKPPEKKEEKQKAEAPRTEAPKTEAPKTEAPRTKPPAATLETPRAAPSPPEKPLAEPQRPPSPNAERPKTEPPTARVPREPRTPPAAPEKPLAEPRPPRSPPLQTPAPPRSPPEFAELEPRAPSSPRAAPPAPNPGPNGGQIVSADDDTAPPDPKKVVGYWVLDPLTVDLRNNCGLARITATMVLTERIAEGRYRGTLRNRIAWAACAPSGALYHVELRIRGSVAEMVGAEGFTDRGVIRGNVMMLEDAYGRSVWRKR
jgi:hypothetical protein